MKPRPSCGCWPRNPSSASVDARPPLVMAGDSNSRLWPRRRGRCFSADSASLTAGVTAIAAGYSLTCAVVNGSARCWGFNDFGSLGDGSTTDSSVPVQVKGLTAGVTAVSPGAWQSCALVGGNVHCWGHNGFGQLGNNTTTNSLVPVQVQFP
jgi:alpha-tubulin suppressor-like RCC1 family protein